MKTFKGALRGAWIPALVLLVAALFGSYVYVQKRIPPTAKASVAVRDALTIDPSSYRAAQVSFDSIVKSDRLAENVQKALGPGAPPVSGKLTAEAIIPSNGINISPLYVVRAQAPTPQWAKRMVDAALTQATKLYEELNHADSSQLTAVDQQLGQAQNQLQHSTQALNQFNLAHGGDVGTQLSTVRAAVATASDRLAQAQADAAAARRVGDAAGQGAANARVTAYTTQVNDAQNQLRVLATLEPEYQNLASDVGVARTTLQQLGSVRSTLVANSTLPVGSQIKVLDTATMESKALLKILVYILGIIVGLLAAMGAIYVEANRRRGREGTEHVIAALGAPALGRIPRRAVVEVN